MTVEVTRPTDLVNLTIDGIPVSVPKGTLVIRAAERVGIQIPRFCDHPLLDPVGACRQCLVEVGGQRKPLASCTTTVSEGMEVRTQLTSPVADKAQQGVMELLLINHPLDCPVCDKGGECPLQNQALSNGAAESRFHDVKRTFAKPVSISAQVLLDRERCVLCARCTRFSKQIAGDPFIDMFERGALQQVAIYQDAPFESYFSGNTIQICPVGALTSAAYRFRSRPFDLVSSDTVCEHCSGGCALRTDHRRGKVMRRLAGEDHEVNEEWNCDKGRFAFAYAQRPDRISTPLIRDSDNTLVPASWREALAVVAERLEAERGRVGVLVGGRMTLEDNYAYAKFARVALDTNDIDFRTRPHSVEEAEFLAAHVVGRGVQHGTPDAVTYRALESAPVVLLVGLEAEEEAAGVFLRLRKAFVKRNRPVYALAPFTTNGLFKCGGTLIPTVPGTEAATLDRVAAGDWELADKLREPGAIIAVGERLAAIPGALSAVSRLATATGAAIAWIPRRAGERGALEAGAVPTLLPGGRLVTDDVARAEVEQAWGVAVPSRPGRDTAGIIAAAAAGQLGGLVIGGVDPYDLPDPRLAEQALSRARFVLSLEMRPSAVTRAADVVLPIAPAVEKSGSYLDWEGRRRTFETTITSGSSLARASLPDCRVLDSLGVEMDVDLFTQTPKAAWAGFAALGTYRDIKRDTSRHTSRKTSEKTPVPETSEGRVLLATWRRLLDRGSMQDGEPQLAGTARPAIALLSEATAADLGVHLGGRVTVSTQRGAITLPVAAADLPPGVVWLPGNSGPATVRRSLGVGHGAVVTVRGGNGGNAKTAWGGRS
jgi:NADH-quinone oxidoreductase subunit G